MKSEWECMATDDLFELHEQIVGVLTSRLTAKKVELERRLQRLGQQSKMVKPNRLASILVTFEFARSWMEASADCIASLSF